MQKDQLKIAAITANYNNGKHIKDCLDGLAEQTMKPKAVFIVDDGSTDGSQNDISMLCGLYETVLKTQNDHGLFLGQYKGITVMACFLPKNAGPSAARNIALQYLVNNTDVICIADADDIYYADKIEKSVDVMVRYPHVALVYSDYNVKNMENGHFAREYKEPYSYSRLAEECIVSNNSVISSNIFKTVGGYDESLRGGEDYDLWLRISENACIYHIPEALYEYRLTGQNATVVTPTEKFAADVRRVHQMANMRRNGSIKNVGH